MEDGTTYLNEEIVRILEVSKEYIEKEKAKQIQEIANDKDIARLLSFAKVVIFLYYICIER
jgi:predicted phosphoribosyltransferase